MGPHRATKLTTERVCACRAALRRAASSSRLMAAGFSRSCVRRLDARIAPGRGGNSACRRRRCPLPVREKVLVVPGKFSLPARIPAPIFRRSPPNGCDTAARKREGLLRMALACSAATCPAPRIPTPIFASLFLKSSSPPNKFPTPRQTISPPQRELLTLASEGR